MREIKGKLSAKDKKIAIIVAQFNSSITEKLLQGAIDCIVRHEGDEQSINVIWVPGAFEVASAAKRIALKQSHDAIICLGAVIRGETSHYDFVAGNAASGIASIGQEGQLPVIFGVITVDNVEQALNRAGMKQGNSGYQAAIAAIDMISVYNQIDKL